MSDKEKLLNVFKDIGIRYSETKEGCYETITVNNTEYKTKGIHSTYEVQKQNIFTFKFQHLTGEYQE